MSFAAVRQDLMSSFSDIEAVAYDYVPPMISTPAIFVFPDDPYVEPITIGSNSRVRINFRLIAAVATNDNQGAIGNLETLMAEVLTAIPSGYQVTFWDKPTADEVGVQPLLVSTMTVSVTALIGD